MEQQMKEFENALFDRKYSWCGFDFSRRLRWTRTIVVQEFIYNHSYVVVPNSLPDCKVLDLIREPEDECSEIQWLNFWMRVHETKETYRFRKPRKKSYNVNGNYLAVYDEKLVKVMLCSQLPDSFESYLVEVGFKKDTKLLVPFSSTTREAYYDKSLDDHCNSCGLARPLDINAI